MSKKLKDEVELTKKVLLDLLKAISNTTSDFNLKKNCEFFINELLKRPNC